MEDLIETPQRARALRWPTGVFLVALLATALADQVSPLGPPKLLGQERIRERSQAQSANWRDGSLAELTERRLRLNSRVRRRVAPFWIAALTRYLKCPAEGVVLGREGWLFHRERALLKESLPDRAVELTRALCLAFDRRLSGRGSRLVLIPIPRKATVAAELLPEGFSRQAGFDPSIDAKLVAGLIEDGAEVVDAGRAWAGLPSGAAYLPLDTHWSDVGQSTLAAEVARRYPAPPEERGARLTVTRSTEEARAALLDFVGVGEHYAASQVFSKGEVERVAVAPEDIPGPGDDPWAVVVGTSFTADFDFHSYLCLATESRMAKSALAATPFGTSLAVAAARWGDRSLPGTVFMEFPNHFVAGVAMGLQRIELGLTQVFMLLPPRATVPLGWGGPASPVSLHDGEDIGAGQAILEYAPGQLLSGGDGALSVQIEVESDVPTRWRLRVDGIGFQWKFGPGTHSTTLPIVEGARLGGGVQLMALDAAGASAEVSMEAVLEVPSGDGWIWGGPASVARGDLAVVRWGDGVSPGSVDIRAAGRTPEGEAVEATWRFPEIAAPGAVLGLTRFRGGSLETVTVRGPGNEPIEFQVEILSGGG